MKCPTCHGEGELVHLPPPIQVPLKVQLKKYLLPLSDELYFWCGGIFWLFVLPYGGSFLGYLATMWIRFVFDDITSDGTTLRWWLRSAGALVGFFFALYWYGDRLMTAGKDPKYRSPHVPAGRKWAREHPEQQ